MQHGTVQEPGNRTEYFAGIKALRINHNPTEVKCL